MRVIVPYTELTAEADVALRAYPPAAEHAEWLNLPRFRRKMMLAEPQIVARGATRS